MATVGVVLSEKVDTTLSKGVLRILGTISGGVIGAPSAQLLVTCGLSVEMQTLAMWCICVLHVVVRFRIMQMPTFCRGAREGTHQGAPLWVVPVVMEPKSVGFLAPGFGVMASVLLANSAWGLACIVCLFTLLIGPVTLTLYRYAAFLFIITLHTIILCQCAPWPLRGTPLLVQWLAMVSTLQ